MDPDPDDMLDPPVSQGRPSRPEGNRRAGEAGRSAIPEREARRPARSCNEVFSIGYEGRALDAFIAILKRGGIERLIDVRDAPFSRKPGFSRAPLEKALGEAGIEYTGLPELGADKALRDRSRSEKDLPAFLGEFRRRLEGRKDHLGRLEEMARERPSAVMCYERDHRDCHRQVLEQRLERAGLRIVHLGEDGQERLDTFNE